MNPATTQPLSREAVVHCRNVLAGRSRSFTLAAQLLDSETADEAAVLYAWCRRADDAVDSHDSEDARRDALLRCARELDGIYDGAHQADPVLAGFQSVVLRRDIDQSCPQELLAGMWMDLQPAPYETLADLELYCFRAAGTVGLMMSHVLGVSSPRALRHAAHLGMAMQLTNICRDVAEDWAMGRLYLPLELLASAGARDAWDRLREGEPLGAKLREPFAIALRRLLAEADRYYASGDAGLPLLPFRAAVAIRAARRLYAAIGDELARRHYDVLAGRAVVPTTRKLLLAGQALLRGAREAPTRARVAFRRADLRGAMKDLHELRRW